MSADQLNLEVIAERPVVRNDQTSDIDIAINLATSKSIGIQSASYAINLCIVIDRSGSMAGEKLEQAKRSCIDIYESLNSNDRLTVLAFDTEVISVVNPQTPRNVVKDRIQALHSGGQTDLSKGWYLGLLELQTYTTDKHINRLVLLSDGQANSGEQKPSVLGAESNRARDELGITTSTIGIGADFQEDILVALAHESGGRFWFIGEARIEDIIKEEFSGALSVFLENPKIEITLPPNVTVVRELNALPKITGKYRIRPIKANDQFGFALRLRIDPTKTDDHKVPISATLFDGAGIVGQAETILSLRSAEEYVQSPEDPRVAMIRSRYLTAISAEEVVGEIDKGDVTRALSMVQSRSELMKELEAKLGGAAAISWETMTEQQRIEAEQRQEELERELTRLRKELDEDASLIAVGQLIDIIRGLGQTERAHELLLRLRKGYRYKQERERHQRMWHSSDEEAIQDRLMLALRVANQTIVDYPDLQEELTAIRGRINEQLERFS